jgi:hypothetical protein
MTKSLPREWRIHGQFAQTNLLAGILPRSGVHFLAGPQGHERDALVADVAVAVASDVVTCGLSEPDHNGARSSLSGFFGLNTGAATGVAIITDAKRADSLSRAIAASSLARGVSRPLPIAVLGIKGTDAQALTAAHARIAELQEWMQTDGVGLGLVIFDLALPHGEDLAFQREGRAVLCVCDVAPAAPDGVIIELGDNRLTFAKPAQGEPWAREFGLDVVKVQDAEALVARPGKAVEPAPAWRAAPVAARKVVAPVPELPVIDRYALIVARGEISTALRDRWTLQGFEVASSQEAALPKPGEIVGGRREIIVAGEDQRPEELKARATRLKEEAVRRGVANVVTIQVAA